MTIPSPSTCSAIRREHPVSISAWLPLHRGVEVEAAIDPPHAAPGPAVEPAIREKRKPEPQTPAKVDFRLTGSRGLGQTWRDRARDNIAAILLAAEIERLGLPARAEQQARLIKFTGFGASDLANGIFRRPGTQAFRDGWEDLGGKLESAVGHTHTHTK